MTKMAVYAMRILPFRFDATEMWVFRELIKNISIFKGDEAAIQDDIISQSRYVFLTCKNTNYVL